MRNFRRLEDVEIELEKHETIFVGANNTGKTSATAAFKLFITQGGGFKIHDFSSPLSAKLDEFGSTDIEETGEYRELLPSIELDLWFTISPSAEYGRIAHFLPSLTSEYKEIGVRVSFSVDDPIALHNAYRAAYPKISSGKQKNLTYFLGQVNHLKTYYGLKYFILEKFAEATPLGEFILHPVDKEKGQNTLKTLLRVEYVDAQRNIADSDSVRGNRLSAVFADYYKHNLKKKENDPTSVQAVDDSNSKLTEHYADQFKPLITVIKGLGFPALNDRDLRIISNLNPSEALSGNTELKYFEKDTEHELPEAYNGLGFKNLIYMATQIAHFQIQWAEMETDRPLCQLIFVEEPEVHLHAQVQQVFIKKIRDVMKELRSEAVDSDYFQQVIISTHSSHITAEADFQCIRYFRRIKTKYSPDEVKKTRIIASEICSLASFNKGGTQTNNIKFLKRYLKLTHCDLFFADAAILVEGPVERLVMPKMIEGDAPELEATYMTVLELGGAYAHIFIPLLEFINLPTLVITDLDSWDPEKQEKCRGDKPGAVTTNGTLKSLLGKESISDLLKLTHEQKEITRGCFDQCVVFQEAISTPSYSKDATMTPSTFEEAFIYENISAIREKKIEAFIKLDTEPNYENDYTKIYEKVHSSNYKKVEFALNIINTDEKWITPAYIAQGLKWLSKTLGLTPIQKQINSEPNLTAKNGGVV